MPSELADANLPLARLLAAALADVAVRLANNPELVTRRGRAVVPGGPTGALCYPSDPDRTPASEPQRRA